MSDTWDLLRHDGHPRQRLELKVDLVPIRRAGHAGDGGVL